LKAPSFAYAKPRSLAETFHLLERHGEGARILAGGQSLIPSLNMRLSSPDLLVDINALDELRGITVLGSTVRIGALTTHSQVEQSEIIKTRLPLLAQAVPHIAHTAIRNRGTIGGSLSLADPAAEYPACALALSAVLCISNKNSERKIKAEEFFKDLFETDLKAGDVLTAVEFPAKQASDRSVFQELTRRHGDYAIIGPAAHRSADGLKLAYFGAGPTPVLARQAASKKTIEEAKAALSSDLSPPADLYHSPATKLHLARVLLERAWNAISK
jgi:aerobic carbon-monoxide dehydrogenase medium subunit